MAINKRYDVRSAIGRPLLVVVRATLQASDAEQLR